MISSIRRNANKNEQEALKSLKQSATIKTVDLRALVQSKRPQILKIARRHEDSDIDFLIELEPNRNLLDHSAMWRELEALLGRKIDLVEPQGLHGYVRDRILQEARPL